MKLRVTGLCWGTSGFPSQRADNVENISIWWRHHVFGYDWLFQGLAVINSPGLGWLYVSSSFPPRSPRPSPPQHLPLTSKPFELKLRYLAQRIYGSGEMYWMTFPWPKVTAVTSISKNLLVCAIKCKRLIRSLQNMAALLPYSWLLSD